MKAYLNVMAQDDFEKWMKQKASEGCELVI